VREIIARAVSVLTVMVVVGLSLLFASQHNPAAAPESVDSVVGTAVEAAMASAEAGGAAKPSEQPPPAGSSAQSERGRAVYEQQKCGTCHSIAGEGNPRNPLDGTGARWDANELRDWVTGAGVAQEVLSPAIVKRKQRYQGMAPEDLEALVTYLFGLKSTEKERTQP